MYSFLVPLNFAKKEIVCVDLNWTHFSVQATVQKDKNHARTE